MNGNTNMSIHIYILHNNASSQTDVSFLTVGKEDTFIFYQEMSKSHPVSYT